MTEAIPVSVDSACHCIVLPCQRSIATALTRLTAREGKLEARDVISTKGRNLVGLNGAVTIRWVA